MKQDLLDNNWSLKELDHNFYAQLEIDEKIIKSTAQVIESILNSDVKPEARLKAYKTLDKQLRGKNAIHRATIVRSISGSNEVQKAVANGCGPSGLGIFPGGWWEECCNEHDICYVKANSVAAKLICDAKFYKCLWSKGAPIVAEVYTLAVLLFGWFAYGPEDEEPKPKPKPCEGSCLGREFRITNLHNFETVGKHLSPIAPFVPNSGRTKLEAEADEISKIEWSKKCKSDCQCRIVETGQWIRNNTTLIVPANDPNSHVSYLCRATSWKREVRGTCE